MQAAQYRILQKSIEDTRRAAMICASISRHCRAVWRAVI